MPIETTFLMAHAAPRAGAHALGEVVHAVEHGVDVGHAVLPVDHDRADLVLRTAERRVEDGAVLGGVDVLAGIHGVAALLDADLARELDEQGDRLVGDEVLREVEVKVGYVEGELAHAVGIGCEPILQADAGLLERLLVLGERLPGGAGCGIDRGFDRAHG